MNVLLADDDRDLVDLLRYAFQRDGYAVTTAFDGDSALRAFQTAPPDLLILDLMMPKRNGMEVLQALRGSSNVPVIVLTAMGDEDNMVNALQLGADDYLVKPFRPRELRVRAQALLRRSRNRTEVQTFQPLTLGDVTLDPGAHEVTVAGQLVSLTRIEFALLQYLMINRDTVLSIPDIIANVWGYDADGNDEVVKVTISRLRRKVETDPSQPRYILNVPGVGYKFQNRS